MSSAIVVLPALLAILLTVLAAWRHADVRMERATCERLAARQPRSPGSFDPAMLAGLPDAATRFFRFAIEPGTPLLTVAVVSMEGRFSLGSKAEPKYMPMHAEQVLAAPQGFVWKVRAGDRLWFSGSDGASEGASWSRFWLFGIVPVARAGGNPDHARAAFGRYVAEAVFWTPAALLPGRHVAWQRLGDDAARVTVTHGDLAQAVDLHVDSDGRPVKVVFQRWSDANPDRAFRLQPFGGYLSEFRRFDGFRLPTRIEAGNFFDTEDYFPFFLANVTEIRFPH